MTSPAAYDFRVDAIYSIPRCIFIEMRHDAAKLRQGVSAIDLTDGDQTTRLPHAGRGTYGGLCPIGGVGDCGRGNCPPIAGAAIEFMERSTARLPLFAQNRDASGADGPPWHNMAALFHALGIPERL